MPSPIIEQSTASDHLEDRFVATNAILVSTAEMLKRAIKSNPGMALLVSASIGVVLACLSKRR